MRTIFAGILLVALAAADDGDFKPIEGYKTKMRVVQEGSGGVVEKVNQRN